MRGFDQPSKYKPFISKGSTQVNLKIGRVREVNINSGLPAMTSTERLELFNDKEHIIGIIIVGGYHRLSLREHGSVFSLFDQINSSTTNWGFKARVVRLWETPACFNSNSGVVSLDMLLVDSQGIHIHATVKKNLLDEFRFKL